MNVLPYNPEQRLLFPAYIKDKLYDDHNAVIINDIVEKMDLNILYYKVPLEGKPSYHPKMMLKILIYAYITGIFSSRKIAQALRENIAFIYLSGWQTPDFRTISDFRKNNLEEFKTLFKQFVDLCKQLGMIKLGHVAIDGTKIKANASDSQTYKEKRIDREIEQLIQEAKVTDETEDALYGEASTDDEIPSEVRNRKDRIKKLQALKKELLERRREKINKTDPDATFMKTRSGIKTSYNAQAAVDEEKQIIIANDVTSEASDANQLEGVVDLAIENSGDTMEILSADAGYSSGENLKKLEHKGIDAYIPDREYQGNQRKGQNIPTDPFHKENFIYNEGYDTYTCPAGNTLSYSYNQKRKDKEPLRIYRSSDCAGCPFQGNCTKNKNGRTISRHPQEKRLKQMREKLDSPEGKNIYGKRKKIVEPVFGVIKNVIGFVSFSLRGLKKVKGEFALVCIAYNLKKIALFLRAQEMSACCIENSIKCQRT
jgi:transposase